MYAPKVFPILVALALAGCGGDPDETIRTVCGDGRMAANELCDDGALADEDGCSVSCALEAGWTCPVPGSPCVATCGDGLRRGAEACDDGNGGDDGCSSNCLVYRGWRCDDASPSRCAPECGDGLQVGAEACDDGDSEDGDGCSAACTHEPGWSCDGAGGGCQPICGDSMTVGDEACDDGNVESGDGCSPTCAISEAWAVLPTNNVSPRAYHSSVWTGSELIVWGGGEGNVFGDGSAFNPATDVWRTVTQVGAPPGRSGHTTAWTGSRMIVWGGLSVRVFEPYLPADGGVYDPTRDAWTPISTVDAPAPRHSMISVWTGTELLVWGGSLEPYRNSPRATATGGRYDPATDSWAPMSDVGAPLARTHATAVWTGTEMIVFGGRIDGHETHPAADGGRYDPVTDTWRPLAVSATARTGHLAVWTGSEMFVWGGVTQDGTVAGDALRYLPDTDLWIAVSTEGAPTPAVDPNGVWTGSEIIVWGGAPDGGGGRYIPSFDRWTPIAVEGQPSARFLHSASWTGTSMIVWGGAAASGYPSRNLIGDGGIYDLASERWTVIEESESPEPRSQHVAVWTGTEMLVWGGYTAAGVPVGTGGRLERSTSRWRPMSNERAPAGAFDPAVVWTGSEMIIFGGFYNEIPLVPEVRGLGSSYDPRLDRWTPLPEAGAPSARGGSRAVWTGREMIIWGGIGDQRVVLGDGARFDPETRQWTPMSRVGAPAPRFYNVAVWTGEEFVVWGGQTAWSFGATIGDGASYDPETDRWTPLATSPLSARSFPAAVWTEDEIIIWGGWGGSGQIGGGAAYHPGRRSWRRLPTENEPPPRSGQASVWTGNDVLIWGGLVAGNVHTDEGVRYDVANDRWVTINPSGAPAPRFQHTAVWTGTEMIIWGGKAATSLGDGAYFHR